MIRYRPFHNGDPPAIADIWRCQPKLRARLSQLSAATFEQLVLSKPFFDRQGLLVAAEGEQLVGFGHAAFGPAPDGADLDTTVGVTCLILTAPHVQQQQIARDLLEQCEQYLRGKGAQQLYAGAVSPVSPFYHGLYGGSDLPGVMAADQSALELYQSAGYAEVDRRLILQRNLAGFRPVMDRQQMQYRRQCRFSRVSDPPPSNWWETWQTTHMDCIKYVMAVSPDVPPCAEALFWDIEPLAASWGVRARGLLRLTVAAPNRRQGLATYLLGEAMKEMRAHSIALVETQVSQSDRSTVGLLQKLGFAEIDQGIVLRKPA